MATLPPSQLLEGKAGAPGAGQAPEAFPHHPHLALAMTLRGQQRQHQAERCAQKQAWYLLSPGPQGHGDKRPKDKLPRDSLAVLITVCSEFQLEATDPTPLHFHPCTWREKTLASQPTTLAPFLRGFPDQVRFLWPRS